MRIFNSAQEIYDFIEELIELADSEGDSETALLLHDALRNNFTASEIMGELRFVLKKVNKDRRKEYLTPFRDDITGVIHAINKSFKT